MASSHIYVLFLKTCPCATHIYILLALRQNPWNINFWVVFEVSGTAEAVFTRHVQPMDQTYPASQTCPAHGSDMSGSQVSAYLYKWAEYPFEP
jgi:hypothetical protein